MILMDSQLNILVSKLRAIHNTIATTVFGFKLFLKRSYRSQNRGERLTQKLTSYELMKVELPL